MSSSSDPGERVAVVGGGLAGLAAAVALSSAGFAVELFEARRQLGGRAASFRDPGSNELVDQCQHVAMGCCTNFVDFCRRTQIDGLFTHHRTLNFVGPDQRTVPFRAARWLPPPLHLGPAFWRLRYLTLRERLSIARALWKLARARIAADDGPTIDDWLRAHNQSDRAISLFWSVVLTSALGEEPQRSSVAAARKVIVDGFLAARSAYVVQVPRVPLGTLYDRIAGWCEQHRIQLRQQTAVRQIDQPSSFVVESQEGTNERFAAVVLAVPWNKVRDLLAPRLATKLPSLAGLDRFEASPITGVHLWFDRPIATVTHAALVGRLGQWIFERSNPEPGATEHYYQVVISASRNLAQRSKDEIAEEICRELAAIWPAAAEARLLRVRVVTEQGAVFSPRPGLERLRPPQDTNVAGLALAGDWTATGWPATMESAVRSGYLAAEAICRATGRPHSFLQPDLPRGWLVRLLLGA
ncbi:MAG TPA: hydroxysqualene dehydroxylase HpnE [Pirellulales bacterium]|jgi:squalene-associated FAD-dependent desaturase|nr:hydroxysqualene dehydroxylase HpnE [Pirellulales bacterium]